MAEDVADILGVWRNVRTITCIIGGGNRCIGMYVLESDSNGDCKLILLNVLESHSIRVSYKFIPCHSSI